MISPPPALLPVGLAPARGLDHALPVRPVDAVDIAEQRGVAIGFHAQDEVGAGRQDLSAHRLFGVEVIAETDRPEAGMARGVAVQPAAGGLGLAVLLGVAVLRGDEFRAQRHRMRVADPDQDRRQHAVTVFGVLGVLAFVLDAGLAVLAVDLARV